MHFKNVYKSIFALQTGDFSNSQFKALYYWHCFSDEHKEKAIRGI